MSLYDLFFEREPTPEAPPRGGVAGVAPAPGGEPGADAESASALLAMLRDRVFNRATPYSRFRKRCASLAAAIPNVDARFAAALATVTADGDTLGDVVSAIALHQSALDGERRTFEQSLAAAEAKDQALAQEADDCDVQIAALEQQLAGVKQHRDDLRRRAAAGTESRAATRAEFDAACATLTGSMTTDGDRLKGQTR